MKYSVYDVKAKHLNIITSEEIDYKKAMTEIFGYKNTFWDRKFLFPFKMRMIYKILSQVKEMKVEEYGKTHNSRIKIPSKIDNISYQARLEIDTIRRGNADLMNKIVDEVALATFEESFSRKFDSDSYAYKRYREFILERPLLEIIFSYNQIETALVESDKLWNTLFQQTQVIDKDYENVGGPDILGRFNMLSTVKKTIADFNVSYKEAFLMPYVLIKTNTWETSCKTFVQHLMTEAKERSMRAQRRST